MQATAAANLRSTDRKVLLAALALGAIAAGLLLAYLRTVDARSQAGVPSLTVVVAREEIPAGVRVTDAMVDVKALPETAVIQGAATAKAQVVGQTLRYPVARGEQLNNQRLVGAQGAKALSFSIPPGMRGFTIPVSVTKSPAALLAPGDFVDVLAAVDAATLGWSVPNGSSSASRSDEPRGVATILQNMQVLAVQRQFVDQRGTYDTSVRGEPPKEANITYVTLATTPEQAQVLVMAVDRAKVLTLSLRPFGDTETRDLSPFVGPFYR